MATKKSGWDAWHEKNAKKALKKIHEAYLAVAAAFLVIGIGTGSVVGYIFTKDDKFELNGEKNISITVGAPLSYTDEGVTCISMGRSLAPEDVEITTNMTRSDDGNRFSADTSVEGEYYIEYKIKSGRFAGLSRVRIFTVTADTADGN